MREKVLSESYPPPPPPPPPQSPLKGEGKHPTAGFIITLIGAILIILEALVYLYIRNILVGALGIIFAVLSIFFGYRGHVATEKAKRNIYGLIPMILGFIVMAASSQIYVDFLDTLVVIFGGLMLAMGGGILISAGNL